jgi:hypothetical protein
MMRPAPAAPIRDVPAAIRRMVADPARALSLALPRECRLRDLHKVGRTLSFPAPMNRWPRRWSGRRSSLFDRRARRSPGDGASPPTTFVNERLARHYGIPA